MRHTLRLSLPYFAALVTLIFLLWAAYRLGQHPDIGASWSATGIVSDVTASGPAAGRLSLGERILTVDGVLVGQAAQFFPGKGPGDAVALDVEQTGGRQTVRLTLAAPAAGEVATRTLPLWVAFAFWGVAVAVLMLAASQERQQSWLFFAFSQLTAVTLASGAVSPFGPAWALSVFGILLWWAGPAATHFHLQFPIPLRRPLPGWVYLLIYLPAGLGSLPDLFGNSLALHAAWPGLYLAGRLWLAAHLLFVMGRLAWSFRRAERPEWRRQIGVVGLGGGLALALILAFVLGPQFWLGRPLVPAPWALTALCLLPLSYGYAILRYRLIRLDRYVSRGAVYTLLVALLSILYGAIYSLSLTVAPSRLDRPAQVLINLLIALVLTAVGGSLYRRLYRGVTTLFYGSWYDSRTTLQQVSRVVDAQTGFAALAHSLSRELQTTMQLEHAGLLLPDNYARPEWLIRSGCEHCAPVGAGACQIAAAGPVAHYFANDPRPVEADRVRRALPSATLTENEARLLNCPHAHYWLPLPGRERPLGFLLLGWKRGGDHLTPTDLEILEMVARQTGPALQNAVLVIELQQRARESVQLHHQAIRSREEERKRIARELHDQIIQALVGLNYELAAVRNSPGEADWPPRLQQEVRRLVADVRQICMDLRPPLLDTLGLGAAVRAWVREVGKQFPFQVRLDIQGDEEQDLPDEVAVSLYRVLQEALFNVQKHAAAHQAQVTLQLEPDAVRLTVVDDGRGFEVPDRLETFTGAGHLGLAGVRERVELLGGRLTVTSAPGRGCRLEAWVELPDDARGAAGS